MSIVHRILLLSVAAAASEQSLAAGSGLPLPALVTQAGETQSTGAAGVQELALTGSPCESPVLP